MVALAGVIVWFVALLFEEFGTADMRWGLWTASATLFLLSAILGARGLGVWAPLVLAAPLVALHGIAVAVDFPLFWPFVPLWIASALVGWWMSSRGGLVAVSAAALLVAMLVGFGGWIIPRALSSVLNVYTDEPAPGFVLAKLDGSPYPMEELEGKVVVLDFFATWCAPCVAELPELETLRRHFADRDDVQILVVANDSGGDTPEAILQFVADRGVDLEFTYDPRGVAHKAFGFLGLPGLVVMDRLGNIRLAREGFNDAEADLAAYLAGVVEDLL